MAELQQHTNGHREQYVWNVHPPVDEAVAAQFPELHPVTLQLLVNRGITSQQDVDVFLNPDYGQDQHDPFLFRDMRTVVERIDRAIVAHEHIVVHGDYDADGVCASAIVYQTLKEMGALVSIYLPHRDTEGYGLNSETVKKLHAAGTHLIITVDCGISNKPEVEQAASLGMDVIVTDHHSEPPALPTAAFAIINPKVTGETYPFKYLAGVGVAFKLCQALIRTHGHTHHLGEAFEKWLLDAVAISTVTDFVELIGENRVLLKYGLIVLQKTRRVGLQRLFAQLNIDPKSIGTETIAYKIGPHINAAGRVGHANAALDLMIEQDAATAAEQAVALARTNKERQQLTDRMAKDALAQAEQQSEQFVIVVQAKDWPVGLVGLVAGKVASKFHRPAFVITHMNGDIVGSGRSIEHFNLVEAIQSMPQVFKKFGGHPMACGFTLKDASALETFTQLMQERGAQILKERDLRKTLQIDMELPLDQVNWEVVSTVEQCAPYGQANPTPRFLTQQATVKALSVVGKNGGHLKLTLEQNGVSRPCIGFGLGPVMEHLHVDQQIDAVYTVGVNQWNGNREIQCELNDIRLRT